MVELIESHRQLEDSKVATLDMGGTLVSDKKNISSHAKINKAFGLSEEDEKDLYERSVGENGDLKDHVEHARSQTEALRGRPEANIQTYAQTVQEIVDEREILEGAHEFVRRLDDRGYETMVVSSAPPALTLPFAEDLDVGKLYRWKDFCFTDEGYFDKVEVKEEAREGKHQIVEGLQSTGADVAHFGNGDNDKRAVAEADAGERQWWTANPERAFDYAFKEATKL